MTPAVHDASTDTVSTGLWGAGRRSLSLGLVLTVTLVASEALAVGTIMPLVARDLAGFDLYGWVFSAFFLAQLVGIVWAGVLIDRRGGLVMPMTVGLGCFAAGLLAGGLAPAMPVLIVGRVLQGLGAGFGAPVAYVAIGRAYPASVQPRMFAALSAAWVLPGILGPAAAGFIASATTWRLVFLGLLPLIAVALAVTLPSLARLAARGIQPGEGPDAWRRLPLALAVAAGAGLALAGLGSAAGQPLGAAALLIVGLVVGLPAFARLVPPGTLRARPVLPAAVLLRGLLTFAFAGAEAYVPLAFVVVRGTSAAEAGIAFAAATLAWASGAWIQARLIEREGAGRLVQVGFGILLVGLAATGMVLVPDVPMAVGIAGLGVTGLGMGVAYAPLTVTVLREAPAGGEGAASAGLQLADILGTALGAGTGGAIILLVAGSAAGAIDPGRTATGVGAAFALEIAVGTIGLALCRRLRTLPPTPVTPDLAAARARP
jgi:MFS family permease